MRVLVTGGTGQIGSALSKCFWPADIVLDLPPREALDLSDPAAIRAYVAAGNYAAVINPAAYTAVDKAEKDQVTAWMINSLAAAALAQVTAEAGIPLIHISTDYVFDGSKVGAYVETDPVAPLGVYGASKEGGEQAVRTGNPRHVILRTAWVFSDHGRNFVKTMLQIAANNDVLRVVDDQYGCPTSASDIASALKIIALRLIHDPHSPTGTYHFVNHGAVTWCGFACEIFRLAAEMGHKQPAIDAIRTKDYPTPARRPANSVLATDKVTRAYGIVPRSWQMPLRETVARLYEQASGD